MLNFFFSFGGRINRLKYWLYHIPLLMLAPFYQELHQNIFVFIALSIVVVWSFFAVQVKRWHDRGKSGLWIIMNLVPVVGPLWIFVELGFFKGTPSTNEYGSNPLEPKGKGW